MEAFNKKHSDRKIEYGSDIELYLDENKSKKLNQSDLISKFVENGSDVFVSLKTAGVSKASKTPATESEKKEGKGEKGEKKEEEKPKLSLKEAIAADKAKAGTLPFLSPFSPYLCLCP